MKHVIPLKSESEFQSILVDPNPILLYFSTPNCSVCHAMLPKLLSALQDKPTPIIEIDASVYPKIAGQQRIFVAPTVLVFYEGKEILRESRFIDIDKIQRLLDLIQSS